MANYPYFSCSRIQTFRKCRRAFDFSYVQGLQEAFDTIEKQMGTAVHEVFRWAYSERAAQRQPCEKSLTDEYRRVWEGLDIQRAKVVKRGRTAEDYCREGLEMALAFFRRVIRNDPTNTLLLEHPFDYRLGRDLLYHGVIDRVARQPDGKLVLIDYKTGRSLPDPARDLQLRSYCLPMFEAFEDSLIQIRYEGLREGTAPTHEVRRIDRSSILAELDGAVSEILGAGSFPASPSTLCDWCGHLPRCGEGKAHLESFSRARPDGSCPLCSSLLKVRQGQFGRFLACSGYPNCRFSKNL